MSDSGAPPSRHGSRKFYHLDSTAEDTPGSTPGSPMVVRRRYVSDQTTQKTGQKPGGVIPGGVITREGNTPSKSVPPNEEDSLLNYINKSVIGNNEEFVGPFGKRKVEYCDYTASGRSLSFLEDYIDEEVLTHYGNTHTTTSVSSLQTTLFRHEARDIIRNAVNASEHDSVVFVGAGCTGAIHKLIHAMKLTQPPVVFVGPYTHHSNLLPWREMGSEVNRVREAADGTVDLEHLEELLQTCGGGGRALIGSFSAASNVTGILVDVDAVTAKLHSHGALAFWDYATAGPYIQLDMNPVVTNVNPDLVAKDAVFLSPHKFVGGVQTPGLLIAKKKLFQNPVPYVSGGGSVFFVRRESHSYLQEAEMREEAGTPAIVESVRAGLVFQLKEAVGSEVIMAREEQLVSRAFTLWSPVSPLVVLGSHTSRRLPVFSFLVRHAPSGLLLHHNYVCVLLNDLFGIQARGGCACAGPYVEDLMGIDEPLAAKYESLLVEQEELDRTHLRRYMEYSHREIIRPGFARLNLPYFFDDDTIDFVLEAVKLVAEEGWKLMPQYNFNPETGEWRHRQHQVFRDRSWLGHISYRSGRMRFRHPRRGHGKVTTAPRGHRECLDAAREILNKAHKTRTHLPDQTVMFDDQAAEYRWFLLPSEANKYLHEPHATHEVHNMPFTPVTYPKKVESREFRVQAKNEKLSEPSTSSKQTKEAPKKSFQEGFQQWLSFGFTVGVEGATEDQESNTDGKESDNDVDGLSEELQFTSIKPREKSVSPMSTDTATPDESLKKKVEVINGNPEPSAVSSKTPNDNPAKSSAVATPEKSTVEAPESQTNGLSCPTTKPKIQITREKEGAGHVWHSPPKTIFKPFVQALEEFEMIQNNDRVLVCLSGGKDSLSLLHSVRQYQFYAKSKGIHFDFGAVTIDPQSLSYDPSPLKGYLKELNVPYFYEEQCILETAENLPYEVSSICSFCSRMKRGRIYHTARREGYNVLALGQHLDDLAESFLMSIFHNGNLRTMKASYTVKEKDLRVIRPFVYVREIDLRSFAESSKLPVIPENCPACFEAPKERHRMKQLLAAQEILHPTLFSSLLAAIKPIFSINRTGVNMRAAMAQMLAAGGDEGEEDGDIDGV